MERMNTVAGHRRASSLVPVMAAAAVGAVVTGIVAGVPGVRFAYESLELHVALESAQGVIALLLAYLALGRLRLTRELPDLVLVISFSAFATTNLFVSALPVALEGRTIGMAMWTAAGLRLVAALSLAVTALVPRRRLLSQGVVSRTIIISLVALGAVIGLAALADAALAELIDPGLSPEASRRPLVAGHPAAITVQSVGTALMAIAAIAFSVKARRTGDDLVRWLAAGATLGAFARLNYVLFPSLYTEWFYTGDLLRLGSYLLFLVGAAREISSYWQRQAELAVMEERRRMARELHDGLTQELTFMRSQLTSTADGSVPPAMIPHVAEAADRALAESRKVISALSRSDDVSLTASLARAAEEVTSRAGAVLDLDSSEQVWGDGARRAELERIVREAVTNAVRHGGASIVRLRVGVADSLVTVRVEDDGKGFDIEAVRRRGFGLTSMRERAERMRGTFHIESRPGHGSVVEVVVPVEADC